MLSDERITKFQELYKKHFGKELSKEEAYEKGAKLVRMVQLVYKPITEKEYQEFQERISKADNPFFEQRSIPRNVRTTKITNKSKNEYSKTSKKPKIPDNGHFGN